MEPSSVQVERFAEKDIAALTAHSKAIGWYETGDWEDFVAIGEVFGHRDASGEIVTSACLVRYGKSLGWIGAFIVNPRLQGRGLGKALMAECLSRHGADGAPLGLVSTEEGKALYAKSGFVEIGITSKLVTEPGFQMPDCASPKGVLVREPVGAADYDAIWRLDLGAVGADRGALLEARMRRAVKNLVAVEPGGRIVGFIGGTLDSKRLLLGPLVAPNAETTLALIASLSRHWDGCMRIDVPRWQDGLTTALLTRGFRLERVCPVMTYDGRPLPISSAHYFALAGQAFG